MYWIVQLVCLFLNGVGVEGLLGWRGFVSDGFHPLYEERVGQR